MSNVFSFLQKKAHSARAVSGDGEGATPSGEDKETKGNNLMKNKRDSQSLSDGQISGNICYIAKYFLIINTSCFDLIKRSLVYFVFLLP